MNRFFKAILITTLVAGTLDILFAYTNTTIRSGQFPTKMFQYIAGGGLGMKDAMNGGIGIILVGVFFHYFISFFFSLLYFLIYPYVTRVIQNKFINGLWYGLLVWILANRVMLVYISTIKTKPINYDMNLVINVSLFILVFGVPISLLADRYYKKSGLRPSTVVSG
jgi:hypothetical protein